MEYTEVLVKLDPLEPWREILIAQLADAGYDSFEEVHDGFKAFIDSSAFDEQSLADAIMLPGAAANPIISMSHAAYKAINWNQEWEKQFEPIWVDDSLYIRAPFHAPNPVATHEIIIEPRMSFGTGHHQTTRLVAMWMLENGCAGKSVLDMGCGTGILAILAARLGAKTVLAIDNYEFAYENTLDNVVRNGFPDIQVIHGDATALGDRHFDMILANITRNVLLEDMATYVGVLNRGGEIIFSGFISQDKMLIHDYAIKLGLKLCGEKLLEDWVSYKFVKD